MVQKLPLEFPYRIVRKIGEGGYGLTYLVEDPTTKKQYILKKIKTAHRQEIEKQYRNMRAVQSKCQQHFVCPKEIVDYKNNLYLIMEFLDGYVELFDFIIKPSKYPRTRDDLVHIAYKLMKGLRAMHKLGVAHRDIKPENIMIHPTRLDVRYIDFGLACRGDKDCEEQPIKQGTPSYMAPEIYFFARKGAARFSLEDMQKTDLFSLGIVIAILFTRPTANPIQAEIIRRKFPSFLSFYQSVECPRILREINDRLIAQPLGNPHIDLLNFLPQDRQLRVSQQQRRRQDQQQRSATTRKLLLSKAKTL